MTAALTPKDIAATEKCSDRQIRREIEAGRLRAYRIGLRNYRVLPEDLERWREAQRVVPRADPVGDALNSLSGRR